MKKLKVILEIEQFRERRKYFMKSQQADIHLLIQNKLIPFHKNFLTSCGFLTRKIESQQQSICLVEEKIQSLTFLKVIGCLYGLEYCFERTHQVISLYQMIRFLDISILRQMIEMDFRKNFDEYGFFILYLIAHKFNVQWLLQQCNDQLLTLGFQQLNFNKYDFFQCQKSVVQELVSLYRQFYQLGVTNLLSINKVKNVLKQYCIVNHISLQLSIYLLIDNDKIIKETDSSSYSEDQKISIKSFKKKSNNHSIYMSKLQKSRKLQQILDQKQNAQQIYFSNEFKSQKMSNQIRVEQNDLTKSTQISKRSNMSHIPRLKKKMSIQTDTELNSPQINQIQQHQYSQMTCFSAFCQFNQSRFLRDSQCYRNSPLTSMSTNTNSNLTNTIKLQREQDRRSQRRTYRSISPPSSPATPQFGQYLRSSVLRSSMLKKLLPAKNYIED